MSIEEISTILPESELVKFLTNAYIVTRCSRKCANCEDASRLWVCADASAIARSYGFIDRDECAECLTSLEKEGYLLKAHIGHKCFYMSNFKGVFYYEKYANVLGSTSVKSRVASIWPKGQIDLAERANRSGRKGKCIIYIYTS